MIYRANLALPPRAQTQIKAASDLVVEAAMRRLAADRSSVEMERLLALHLLHGGTTSELVRLLSAQTTIILTSLFIRNFDLDVLVGTGRRFARDHGGRLVATADQWADSFRRSLAGSGSFFIHRLSDRELWDVAHPTIGKALNLLAIIDNFPQMTDDMKNIIHSAIEEMVKEGAHHARRSN